MREKVAFIFTASLLLLSANVRADDSFAHLKKGDFEIKLRQHISMPKPKGSYQSRVSYPTGDGNLKKIKFYVSGKYSYGRATINTADSNFKKTINKIFKMSSRSLNPKWYCASIARNKMSEFAKDPEVKSILDNIRSISKAAKHPSVKIKEMVINQKDKLIGGEDGFDSNARKSWVSLTMRRANNRDLGERFKYKELKTRSGNTCKIIDINKSIEKLRKMKKDYQAIVEKADREFFDILRNLKGFEKNLKPLSMLDKININDSERLGGKKLPESKGTDTTSPCSRDGSPVTPM